jgi:hypothetical protein
VMGPLHRGRRQFFEKGLLSRQRRRGLRERPCEANDCKSASENEEYKIQARSRHAGSFTK